MDFATRDNYRHVVENISKKSELSEEEVARIAIELMLENVPQADADQRTAHVGYNLIGKGGRANKEKSKNARVCNWEVATQS